MCELIFLLEGKNILRSRSNQSKLLVRGHIHHPPPTPICPGLPKPLVLGSHIYTKIPWAAWPIWSPQYLWWWSCQEKLKTQKLWVLIIINSERYRGSSSKIAWHDCRAATWFPTMWHFDNCRLMWVCADLLLSLETPTDVQTVAAC